MDKSRNMKWREDGAEAFGSDSNNTLSAMENEN